MKLYLAEKPSLGRAIASALPKPHKKGDGCIYVSNGDVVSWCIGHVLEQAEPEAYDKSLKKWSLGPLPILPEKIAKGWKLVPKQATRKQFSIIKKLIKKAGHIIHCGDPDREGQLLVDEVINHVGISKQIQSKLQRCLINDLNQSAIKKSLANLKPNHDFSALSISALARSRADWLYGLNLTRAYTLQAQTVGFKGVVSIGRVQTPILGLIVKRDYEIEQFTPVTYFEVFAHISINKDSPLILAKWKPSDACSPFLDSEGRVLSKALAENVLTRIHGKSALVAKVENKNKKQSAPLPYNLSSLQIDAAKRYNLSAKMVLDTCQALYEKHKLITYPRSDNRYLPLEHHKQAAKVLEAIEKNTELKALCKGANLALKSKAWDNAKISAHHAIIPTDNAANFSSLSPPEKQIYTLISRQYLCQFYPAWEYTDGKIEFRISGGLFISKARTTTMSGWKEVLNPNANENTEDNRLPQLTEGQTLVCAKGELIEKLSKAPQYFTDATLLAAITGIARYVSDLDIKKVLRETDGLGTEATRANIIELLFKRHFIQRKGKLIQATEAGKGVINSLPESMTLPDMTAQWELKLNAISLRQCNYQAFMTSLETQLTQLLDHAIQTKPNALQDIKQNNYPKKSKRSVKHKRKTSVKA